MVFSFCIIWLNETNENHASKRISKLTLIVSIQVRSLGGHISWVIRFLFEIKLPTFQILNPIKTIS